jgi:hypothetical protein
MAKLQFFNLFGNSGTYLSAEQIKRILILAFGISQSKSVNISYVNDVILLSESGCKNEDSQYNWLLKLFQTGNYDNIIRNSFHLLVVYFYGGQSHVKLVIDRTNWDLGTEKINILTIGLLTDNQIFIPLIWEDLGHRGNSHSFIRIALIDRLLTWWKALNIPLPTFEICGDREFIGEYWLTELARRDIYYVIRLRCDLSFETWLNDEYKIDKRFTLPCLHRYMRLCKKESVEVVLQNEAIAQVFIVENEGNDAKQEPFIYFITNLDNLDQAALDYRKRWKIEVFFKYMKTQGFNLEAFNMSGQHKANILMAVLSIVFLMVLELDDQNQKKEEVQEEIVQKKAQKVNTYKNGKSYPRKSDFRRGRTTISKIRSVEMFIEVWKHIMQKILLKLQFLNQLYIKKIYAQ